MSQNIIITHQNIIRTQNIIYFMSIKYAVYEIVVVKHLLENM